MRTHMLHAVIACSLVTLPTAAPAQGPDSVTVDLEPVRGSGVSGTVVMYPRRGETDFVMTLTADDPARQRESFDIWLRAGTCSAPGRAIEDIDDIRADGRTEDEDEDVILADLLRSDHILEVRIEDRDEVVACGSIRE